MTRTIRSGGHTYEKYEEDPCARAECADAPLALRLRRTAVQSHRLPRRRAHPCAPHRAEQLPLCGRNAPRGTRIRRICHGRGCRSRHDGERRYAQRGEGCLFFRRRSTGGGSRQDHLRGGRDRRDHRLRRRTRQSLHAGGALWRLDRIEQRQRRQLLRYLPRPQQRPQCRLHAAHPRGALRRADGEPH